MNEPNESEPTETEQKRTRRLRPLKVLAVVLAIAAIVKELRLPAEQRTWHGLLAGLVPYDFRMPTWDRIRTTFWNPSGSILVGQVFGVGWTINFGALITRLCSRVCAD